jgi:hypothetical protein
VPIRDLARELPTWLRSVALAADPAAVAASYAAMLDWRGVLPELGCIQVPTPVLAGDHDPGLTDLRATADKILGARLALLAGCRASGHLHSQ